MNNINTMPSAYIATSDTSKGRAQREDAEGITTERRRKIMEHVTNAGAMGIICPEVERITGLHHGQASGTLNALHELGLVAQLKEVRNNCHPYIAAEHIELYEAQEVQLEPRKSKNTRYIELLEELAEAAYDVAYKQTDGAAYNRLRKAIDEVRRHQGLKK